MCDHSVTDIWIAFEGPSLSQLYTNKKKSLFYVNKARRAERSDCRIMPFALICTASREVALMFQNLCEIFISECLGK